MTTATDCYPEEGMGGAIAHFCQPIIIDFSEPLPGDRLSFALRTSLGDELTEAGGEAPAVTFHEGFGGSGSQGLVSTIRLVMPSPGGQAPNDPPPTADEFYAPTWVELDLSIDGALVASERFEPIAYACVPEETYNWCWKAAPFNLEVSAPDP